MQTGPTIVIATLLRQGAGTGVQSHFMTLQRYLDRRRAPTVIATPFEGGGSFQAFLAARRAIDLVSPKQSVAWYRYWHPKFLAKRLRECLRQDGRCVIYAQCPLSAEVALQQRTSPRQRVVLAVHFNISQAEEWVGAGLLSRNSILYRQIVQQEREVLARVDGIVCVSEFMRGRLIDLHGESIAKKAVVVPNFVSDVGSAHALQSRDLMTVGTLEPRKNQEYALEIIAASIAQGTPLSLSIAGHGPDARRLRGTAAALGISDQVSFLGHVNGAGAKFLEHRACLHVAKMENLPIALIEALSCARPIFAVPVGGIPEVYSDGVEGRFIPASDAVAAARVICDFLRSPRYKGSCVAARQRYEVRFAEDVAAERLLESIVEFAR